jgi:deazaflavin-dependent oxidoreductase (nitroreductase family)
MEVFWKIHPWLYRVSGGRILGRVGKTPILLLNTRGRKSGEPRTNALMYLADGNRFVVAASFAGEPKHPAWWLNLKREPTATVQVGAKVVRVRAREAEGAERQRLWSGIVAQDAGFAEYERRTTRRIPVVVLEPA